MAVELELVVREKGERREQVSEWLGLDRGSGCSCAPHADSSEQGGQGASWCGRA
jgi:hypothetical protein